MNYPARTHAHPSRQPHKSHRAAVLRAAILGADDGIVSTASLMLGVAAAQSSTQAILVAGLAGLVAGALSMAAGEFVSVSSQRDSALADLKIEAHELRVFRDEELEELAGIYVKKGVKPELALTVARQIHHHNALDAHAQEELGINRHQLPDPWAASLASAISYAAGAALPVVAAVLYFGSNVKLVIIITTMLALLISGAIGAHYGGGNTKLAAIRVLLGGSLAMIIASVIGLLVGQVF